MSPAGFDVTWATFLAAREALGPSPGALEAWHRGRARYAVWILEIDEPAALARQAAVADRLAGLVVPVPPGRAHVTVWVCGFPCKTPVHDDDVTEAVLEAQVAAARKVTAARLALGAANAFLTCAFLEVHDRAGELAALRAALAVPGAREVRFSGYLPHLTIGRFPDARPTAPIAARLEPLRALEPIPLLPSALALIELDARAPEAPWRTRFRRAL